MPVYRGTRTPQGVIVTKDDAIFLATPSRRVHDHSPTGFEWGYGGSGPAQLALALLLDVAGREVALQFYQSFKWQVVSRWEGSWEIYSESIKAWLAAQQV